MLSPSASGQRHCFSTTAWWSTPLPPGATRYSDPPCCSYRLATPAGRQAPHQKYLTTDFGTLTDLFQN